MKPKDLFRASSPKSTTIISLPKALTLMALFFTTACLLLTSLPAWASSGDTDPEHKPVSGIPRDPLSWHRYVRAPDSDVVLPFAVLEEYTRGQVLNPQGMISGDEPTVLERDGPSSEVPSVVVDFGINTVGIVSISFAGAEGVEGSLPGVRLAFSETLKHLGEKSDFTRSYNAPKGSMEAYTSGTDQIAVEVDPYTWTNQLGCRQAGRKVCSDGLHGFRYMRISLDALPEDSPFTTSQGRVSISSLSLRLSAFRGGPETFTGWFECSDEDLTQWWFDGVYTNDLCTDVFRVNDTEPRNAIAAGLVDKLVLHDAPKRDRDPYVGDLAVAGLTTYLSHETSEAVGNVLADLADHQRADGWIPPASIFQYTLHLFDYPLWWVVCSYDYVLHTGNTTFIDKYYQHMVRTLDNFYPSNTNTTTGLVHKARGYGDYAFLPRSGPVTYYNALYVHALQSASALASFQGKDDDAERWTARAENVAAALNRYNFDEKVGAFFDGTCGGGPGKEAYYCDTHAQDGNSLAILTGVASPERAESVLSHWAGAAARPWGNAFYDNGLLGRDYADRVYAFISYFEIAARFERGLVDSALEETRRLWGYMAARDPGVTFWEGSGEAYNSDSFKSMSHGWSTGVVPLMSRYILGVTPTGPGFSTWRVKPRPGDLEWARGVVPVPGSQEGIRVLWKKGTRGAEFMMDVRVPEGLGRGVIAVPVGQGEAIVRVNGEVVWRGNGGVVAERSRGATVGEDGYVEFEAEGRELKVVVRSRRGSSEM